MKVAQHGSGIDGQESCSTSVSLRPAPLLEEAVKTAVQRLLGLQIDLAEFYQFAAQDPKLGPLVRRFRGLKPPRFLTVFEALVNGIACQQITLTQGLRLLNRLAERYGPSVHHSEAPAHAFPRPEDLAMLEPEVARTLGFSGQKARALIELSGTAAAGRLDLEGLASLDDLLSLVSRQQSYEDTARVSMGIGLAGAVGAVAAGLHDYSYIPRERPTHALATTHAMGMVAATSLFTTSFILRERSHQAGHGPGWMARALALGGWGIMLSRPNSAASSSRSTAKASSP
jgi:hypothetical protein